MRPFGCAVRANLLPAWHVFPAIRQTERFSRVCIRAASAAEGAPPKLTSSRAPDGLLFSGPGARSSYRLKLDTELLKVMKENQIQGVQWLLGLWEASKGGLLCDDPGQGKSLQVSAMLRALLDNVGECNVLIVAPKNLLYLVWVKELRACGIPDHLLYVCTTNEEKTPMPEGKRIILINYDAVCKRPDLEETAWDCVFCDEGHALSNRSYGYERLMRLQSRIRVLISGTPFLNRLKQFYNLFDLCNPGLAGTEKDFKRDVIEPIEQGIGAKARQIGLDRESKEEALQDEEILKDAMAKYLRDFLKPYFKRCVKTEENLPPLRQYVVHVQLSAAQMSAYHQVLARGYDKPTGFRKARSKLRKLCWQPVFALQSDQLLDQHVALSAKLQALLELLQKFAAAGEKTLVFSSWHDPLDMLKQGLRHKGFAEDRDYVSVDGRVEEADRPKLLDKFQDLSSSVSFLLMAKKVGKEGLTLTAATNVVIMEPSLNPTEDEQAACRAHRIGQTKPVTVYRFACAGTIEEIHFWKQELKTLIARMLLAPESHSA